MECVPFYCHLEFCIECDKVTPYVEWICIYCGGDTPFGEWSDDDITMEDVENYHKEQVCLGDLRTSPEEIKEIIEKYY